MKTATQFATTVAHWLEALLTFIYELFPKLNKPVNTPITRKTLTKSEVRAAESMFASPESPTIYQVSQEFGISYSTAYRIHRGTHKYSNNG